MVAYCKYSMCSFLSITPVQFFSDCDDHYLKWLEEKFFPNLWQQWLEKVEKFGKGNLKIPFLSEKTYEGLCMATKGMVALVCTLLQRGLLCVLSWRISQDSLEAYFGHQRSLGRRHQNPGFQQFGYRNNTIVLQYSDNCI